MLGGKGPYNRKSRRCEAYRGNGDAPGKLRDEISLAIGAAVVHIVVGDLVDSDTTPIVQGGWGTLDLPVGRPLVVMPYGLS